MEKLYDWSNGAVLGEHSKRKHKILREYFAKYLEVRCQLPLQERFRLAVVDGFAGGGRYNCGSAGSPIIFIEELRKAIIEMNLRRSSQGLADIQIECLLILNDSNNDAINSLKSDITPLIAEIRENVNKLHIQLEYLNEPFHLAYSKIKSFVSGGRYRNVVFNLDQCGHKRVDRTLLLDIMHSYPSAEIFYTFCYRGPAHFPSKIGTGNAALAAKSHRLRRIGLGRTSESYEQRCLARNRRTTCL